MKNFKSLSDFNSYLGVPASLRDEIDVGLYHGYPLRLSSPSVSADFYRISIKHNFQGEHILENYQPDFSGNAFMFFSSPKQSFHWDTSEPWRGYYVQMHPALIHNNKHLFYNFLEYGQHEGLYLTEAETQKITELFNQVYTGYHDKSINSDILLGYVHLLFSFINLFYKRQFKDHQEGHNRITQRFVNLLNEYYPKEYHKGSGTPSVNFFAEKLCITPNYLSDTIKAITGISPIDHIHQHIVAEAKGLLRDNSLTSSEVAFQLGFDYPNYFSRLFRKVTGVSPSEYRNQ
ncbi:MAG TPA: AraC family transcriptional regulator [Cytophagales bacterium]|nr:AraC family transcriptional regulator [Cytophagales bacterium]HAA20958.1 AraC family transcriptional regulator [Cytophagales bacterium]HAP63516.1 AraC family transcriptional regulator [Cytophagales bacterium]